MSAGSHNAQPAFFLGVDGGGTKTAFSIVDDNGAVCASRREAACHYMSDGIDTVAQVLDRGIGTACQAAGIDRHELTFTAIGLPGYGEVMTDISALDAMPARVLGHDRYCCVNDTVCGWAGSLGATDGINVVAGTGSLTYGEYQGKQVRCGGWGWRFGDEGSAYWVGNRGLNLFTRMCDGRLSRSALYDLFFQQLDLHDSGDVIARFLSGDALRPRIAELAVIVLQAAAAGDTEARAVIEQGTRELALIVDVTRQKLAFDATVPVSYSGGLFKSPMVIATLRRHLDAIEAQYELREPLYTPEIGAATYAAKCAGTSITPALAH